LLTKLTRLRLASTVGQASLRIFNHDVGCSLVAHALDVEVETCQICMHSVSLGNARYKDTKRDPRQCLRSVIPASTHTLENMGDLYAKQVKVVKARGIYAMDLSRLTSVLSRSREKCMKLAVNIDALPSPNGERRTVESSNCHTRPASRHNQTKKRVRLLMRKLLGQ
jgi:hypothetical protein